MNLLRLRILGLMTALHPLLVVDNLGSFDGQVRQLGCSSSWGCMADGADAKTRVSGAGEVK